MKRNLGTTLRRRGFDTTRYDRVNGHWIVGCSQCEALVVNRIACHERGCPNALTDAHVHDYKPTTGRYCTCEDYPACGHN